MAIISIVSYNGSQHTYANVCDCKTGRPLQAVDLTALSPPQTYTYRLLPDKVLKRKRVFSLSMWSAYLFFADRHPNLETRPREGSHDKNKQPAIIHNNKFNFHAWIQPKYEGGGVAANIGAAVERSSMLGHEGRRRGHTKKNTRTGSLLTCHAQWR